jgi:hypothetical protein
MARYSVVRIRKQNQTNSNETVSEILHGVQVFYRLHRKTAIALTYFALAIVLWLAFKASPELGHRIKPFVIGGAILTTIESILMKKVS